MEPNQDDAPDHFLSAKRLHTRPTFGSNDRFLLLKPFILPMAKPAQQRYRYRTLGPYVSLKQAV